MLAVAAAVRLVALDAQPLWWDEGWSAYFAHLPLGRMVHATAQDIHPPLYYALLHLWGDVFGFAPLSLRALSLLLGLGLVAAVRALAGLLLERRAVLPATAAAALAPLLAYYSREVRMYGLLALLVALSWYCLLRALETPRRRWRLLYAVIAALALYTEYYAVLALAGQAAYVLLTAARPRRPLPLRHSERSEESLADTTGHAQVRQGCFDRLSMTGRRDSLLTTGKRDKLSVTGYRRGRRPIRALVAMLATPAVLYLPWLAYAVPRLVGYVGRKQAIEGYQALDPLTFAGRYLSAFAAGHHLGPEQPWLLWAGGALALLLLAAAGYVSTAGDRRLPRLLLCYLGLPLLGGYLINLLFPFTPRFFERVLLFAAPPLYLLAGAGLAAAWRRGTATGALGLALLLLPASGLGYLWTVERYPGQDYRPVFREVRRLGAVGDVVLCVHPWQYGYAVAYLPERLHGLRLVPAAQWERPEVRRLAIESMLAGGGRIWFPAHQSLGRILEGDILADLDSLAARALSRWHGSETLLVAHAPRAPLLVAGAASRFEGGPALSASEHAPDARAGSGAVHVRLTWDGLPEEPGLYQASLRLTDGMGHTWVTHDLPIDAAEQHLALLVPWGTPAAPLTLGLVLSRDGEELAPVGLPPGERLLPLGTVTIAPAQQPAPPAVDLGLRPIGAATGGGLELAGVAPLPAAVAQGETLSLELYWLARRAQAAEAIVFVQAIDAGGSLAAAAEGRATGGLWPMEQWPAGTLVRDRHRLTVPAGATGRLRLIAGLLDPVTRRRLPLDGRDHVVLGEVAVAPVERSFAAPALAVATDIRFGDLATLVGYDAGCVADGEVCRAQGEALALRLVWRGEAETGARYRSFVHLACGDEIAAQSVHEPPAPTTAWLPGQYVVDEHKVPLPPVGACAGPLRLLVGLYDPDTGARLPVPPPAGDGEGRALLLTVAP